MGMEALRVALPSSAGAQRVVSAPNRGTGGIVDAVVEDAKPTVEPTSFTERFATFRRVIVFLLGCAVVIDALTDRNYVVPELIIGIILLGVLPIDDLVRSTRKRGRGG